MQKSYWGFKSKANEANEKDIEFDEVKQDQVGFENDPKGLNTSISIEKITKVTKFSYSLFKYFQGAFWYFLSFVRVTFY